MIATLRFAATLLFAFTGGPAWAERTPADWVNPQIDTVKPRWFYFNSACRPFGMVNLSPDTRTMGDWNAGYRHNDDTIECFSHIHCWQLAGLAVMPVTGKTDPAKYASRFSHDGEVVRPGYHKVFLQTHGITAELTSTTRVGFHRYTYPEGESARVVLDLARPLMECSMRGIEVRPCAGNTALEGTFTMGRTMRRPKPLKVYFVAEFQKPFKAVGDWGKGRAVVEFDGGDAPLIMKVAISYTGLEGARANLAAELPHWDFDRVRKESADDWNAWLGRIQVEGGTDAQKTKFYTDLWHALLGRRILSDVDGRYIDNTGSQAVVRQGKLPHYNFDALWGTHWSVNVLWPLAWPEVMDGFAETMVNMYRHGGLIPKITIQLNSAYHPGKTFVITAKNNRRENCYIQSARLNGHPWNSFQLSHDIFAKGGTLELELGSQPNPSWGTRAEE